MELESALGNPEYFKEREIAFKMSRKEYKKFKKALQSICPIYFTNNWRKITIYHLSDRGERGNEANRNNL